MFFITLHLVLGLGSGFVTASEMEILSDSIGRYYLMRDVSIYTEGIEILSDSGIYRESELKAVLWGEVSVTGQHFKLTSDTLIFWETDGFMRFIGNSIYKDTAYSIEAHEFEKLGDTAKAFNNVHIILLREGTEIFGDTALYFIAAQRGFVYGSPRVQIPHDTSKILLSSEVINFTKDTLYAFGGVIIEAPDAYGKADSAFFTYADSTLELWHDSHVRWKDGEAAGKTIILRLSRGEIRSVFVDEGFMYAEGETGIIRIDGKSILLERKSEDTTKIHTGKIHKGMFIPKRNKT